MAFHYFMSLPFEIRSRIWKLCIDEKQATEIRLLYRNDDEDTEHAITIPEDYAPDEPRYGMAPCPFVYTCHDSLAAFLRDSFIRPTTLSTPPPANINWEKVSLVCLHDEMNWFCNAPLSDKIQNLILNKAYVQVFHNSDATFERLCALPTRFPALRSLTALTYADLREYEGNYFFSFNAWSLMLRLTYTRPKRQFKLTLGHTALEEEQWVTEENYQRKPYWRPSLMPIGGFGYVDILRPVLTEGGWGLRVELGCGGIYAEKVKLVDDVTA